MSKCAPVEQWGALSKPIAMLELGEKKKKNWTKEHIFLANINLLLVQIYSWLKSFLVSSYSFSIKVQKYNYSI